MIQLLFLVLVAFSCFEGSDSENKCGNVEQKTVKPTTISCPKKTNITDPIWKPVPPEYLKSGYLVKPECSSVNKKETELKPSCPPCPRRNDTPKPNDSGENNSEKPPVKEKQECSGSDDKKAGKKNTDSTRLRRSSPKCPYLDI